MRGILPLLVIAALATTASATHFAAAGSGTFFCTYMLKVSGVQLSDCNTVGATYAPSTTAAGTYTLTVSWTPVATTPPNAFNAMRATLTLGCGGVVCVGGASNTQTVAPGGTVTASSSTPVASVTVSITPTNTNFAGLWTSLPPQGVGWTVAH